MPELRHPHEYKVVAGVNKLVKENFTARFVRRDETPLTIQGGNVFSDGGVLIEDIPEWLLQDYEKLPAETKEKLKLKLPAKK